VKTKHPPVQWVPGLFLRGKVAGAWMWPNRPTWCWG